MKANLPAAITRFYPISRVLPYLILGQLVFYWIPQRLIISLGAGLFVAGLLTKRISFLFISLGLISAFISSPPKITEFTKDSAKYGQIISEPRYNKVGEVTFEFKTEEGFIYACKTVELPWKNSSHVTNGAKLYIRGSFYPVSYSINPFAFENSLLRSRVSGKCKAQYLEVPREVSAPFWSKLREQIQQFLVNKLGQSEITGVLVSMAIGMPNGVSDITENEFRVLGLLHILVVSGFQVGILYYTLFFVIKYFPARFRFILEIIVLGIIALYVQICGSEHAVVRALIALVLAIAAHKTAAKKTLFGTTLTALFIVSIIWPGAIFDLGTELTFGALFGISLGLEFSKTQSKFIQGISSALMASMITSLICTIWGRQNSLLGLILNLIFPPLLSWLAGPMLLFATSIDYISESMGQIVFDFIYVALGLLLWSIKFLAPYGIIFNTISLAYITALLYLIVIGWVLGIVSRRWLAFRGLRKSTILGEG